MLSVILYNTAIKAYFFTIQLAALFNQKARKWISGRKDLFMELKGFSKKQSEKVIWMHCASHGEFEQGRPLLDAIKKYAPETRFMITFFSPTGIEHASWQDYTEKAFCLPRDSNANALAFIKIVKPDLVLFVKYEFWYHFLKQLEAQNIPTVLVAASFRPNQIFFKWYGGIYRKMLRFFDLILIQYPGSGNLLKSIGIQHFEIVGDPRVDRVTQIANTPFKNDILEEFCGNSNVLIAGSTWPADEKLIGQVFQNSAMNNWKLVLVPHEIDHKRIDQILYSQTDIARISELEVDSSQAKNLKILIVDKFGLLSRLYRYGTVAYVGGGFGSSGIHNILEPVAYKLPVLIGPNHSAFPEAQELIKAGVIKCVADQQTILNAIGGLESKTERARISDHAKDFLQKNSGAVLRMMDRLKVKGMLW